MKDTLFDQAAICAGQRPKTGSLLAPLFTWRGRDVYPFFGAESDEGEGGESDGEPNTDDEDGTGEDGGDKGGQDTVTREEFEKLRKQLSAADKNKSAAEKKLKEIEDAKKDELTKATERAEQLEKTVTQQSKELSEMRLQNAFLTADTGVTWHDPADALDIAERRGYLDEVVGEDGKVDVTKLTAKLKELAKAKPNLVKSSEGEGKKEEPEKKTPTGQKVGSRGTGGGAKEEPIPARYAKYVNT